jgi:hypothetical protein
MKYKMSYDSFNGGCIKRLCVADGKLYGVLTYFLVTKNQ